VLAIAESLSQIRSDLGDQACIQASSPEPSQLGRKR
jgi:hypothetical protein